MSLIELLEMQRDELQALLALLWEEQSVLLANIPDIGALDKLTGAKQECFERIASTDARRRDMQRQLGFTENLAGAERAASHEGCLAQWQTVYDLARQTAYHNELNGSLIRLRMAHSQRVLKHLRNLVGSPLYQANGQTEQRRSRIDASA